MEAAAINWTPLVIDHLNPSSSIWPTIAHVIASAKVKSPWAAVAPARARHQDAWLVRADNENQVSDTALYIQ
jgi:hypothetical protein